MQGGSEVKVGDLYWVYEGCVRTLDKPVIYLGRSDPGPLGKQTTSAVVTQRGEELKLADYYYTLIPVDP